MLCSRVRRTPMKVSTVYLPDDLHYRLKLTAVLRETTMRNLITSTLDKTLPTKTELDKEVHDLRTKNPYSTKREK
jgi:hypothetical protein